MHYLCQENQATRCIDAEETGLCLCCGGQLIPFAGETFSISLIHCSIPSQLTGADSYHGVNWCCKGKPYNKNSHVSRFSALFRRASSLLAYFRGFVSLRYHFRSAVMAMCNKEMLAVDSTASIRRINSAALVNRRAWIGNEERKSS